MQAEILEVMRFLQDHAPFAELPEDTQGFVAHQTEISYVRAGQEILNYGDPINDLYLVRSGAVETYRRSGDLYNRLDRGDTFGHFGLFMNRKVRYPVKAIEDTLLYCIPADLFDELCDRYDFFSDFFESDGTDLLRQAISQRAEGNDLTTVKVKSLICREAVSVTIDSDIPEIARTMTEERVSSILVTDPDKPIATDPDDDDGQVVGIITDRDLRTRVLAQGRPLTTRAGDIMSADMVIIDDNAYVFEAMLTMLRQNVHHLPIVHRSKPIGVIALSDIVQHESQNSLLFVRSILSQNGVEDLAELSQQLPNVFSRMVNEDANSHMIGSAMAVIGRAFKQRLLELAEEKFGPPPVPYCFLALGSMARDEQLIVTDQDNAIILDNGFEADKHDEYFRQLAEFVCDGLAQCGYRYCDGGIMANNPEWRLTVKQWQQQFSDWIDNPSPKALLHSSIFFDLDGVHGKLKWAKQLSNFISKKAKHAPKFLAYLARNSLNRTPPLGFFKGFVMEQDGEHKNSINLKRRGTAPLSDVIRVHALAIGSRAQNSFERLDDIKDSNLLPPGKARDLSDALEYIAMVRIRHQALDIENAIEPDNNIEPDNLSTFERRNLKEAFQVLDKAQAFLKFRYQSGRPVDVR